jgi:hypothetical protein
MVLADFFADFLTARFFVALRFDAAFFTGDFFAAEVFLADTRPALAGFVAGLDDRVDGIVGRLNNCHSGMRLLAQARNL